MGNCEKRLKWDIPCFTPGKVDEAIKLAWNHTICVDGRFQKELENANREIEKNSENVKKFAEAVWKKSLKNNRKTLDNFLKEVVNHKLENSPFDCFEIATEAANSIFEDTSKYIS